MRLLTALLSTALPLQGNGQVQLLPAGEFAARDGRPGQGRKWKLNDAQGEALAAQVNDTIAATPIVIDYEHQTLFTKANGQPAPAAGWLSSVTWLAGKGLMGTVEWTALAAQQIKDGAYRYISPVITWAKDTGQVTGLHMAALTNFPALLGMDAATALSSLNPTDPDQEPTMNKLFLAIAALTGVAVIDEATALAAVQGFKPAQTPLSAALTAALGLQAGADEAAALTAVTKLKAPSDASAQLVATLQAQVTTQGQALAALTAQLQGDQVVQSVDAAITAGKITAATRDAYIELGKKDVAALTSILAVMTPIPGIAGQAAQTKAAASGADKQTLTALTADQTLIAKQLGYTADEYLKVLQAA